MVKIIYVQASGAQHVVDAKPGRSIMENAVKNGVPGIAADCGGSCACGTCRIYVSEAWREKLSPPAELEQSMIEYCGDTTPGLRLSCQVIVTPELEGIAVRMPESQH